MYYVSENHNTAAQAQGRHILIKALFNGERELTGDHLIDMTVTEATAASGGLTMGSTISSKLTLSLRMPAEPLSLEGGFVEPWVGFDGVDELCPLGKFNITKVESKDEFVTATIEAYDDFSKTEEEYVPAIDMPAAPELVVRDIASQKHLTLADGSGAVAGIGTVRLDNVSPVPQPYALEIASTNLFNNALDFKSSADASVSYSNGRLTISGYYTSKYITLKDGRSYAFSCTSTRTGTGGGGLLIRAYTADNSQYTDLYSAENVLSPSVVVSLPEGYPVLRVTFYGSNANETASSTFSDIMLNAGTEPLPYVEYIDPSASPCYMLGKNLVETEPAAGPWGGLSERISGDAREFTIQQDVAANFRYVCIPIPDCAMLVGHTVTVSGKAKTSGVNTACLRIQWLNANDAAGGSYFATPPVSSPDEFAEISITGTIPPRPSSTYNVLSLLLYTNTSATLEEGTHTVTYRDVQIELGDSVTSYEAYNSQGAYVAGAALPAPTATIIADTGAYEYNEVTFHSGAQATISVTYNKDILGIAPGIEIGYVEGTIRQYLGWIAGLGGKNAKFDRRGELTFKWYASTDQMIGTELQYLGGLKKTTEDAVKVRSISSGTSENVIVAGTGTGFSFENPYMTQEILEGIFERVSPVQYTPSEIKWRGNPSVEAGDIVLSEDKDGNFHTIYVMEQTLKVGGGLHSEIKCFGKSDEEIQFGTSPTAKKIQQVYTSLQTAIKNATALLNSANGGVFEITDDNGDGVNDGWVIHSLDEQRQVFANVNGIGITTDGRATVKEAITPAGIVASAIKVGKIKADMIAVGNYDEENPDVLADYFLVDLDDEGHPVVTIGASNSPYKQRQTNTGVAIMNGEQTAAKFSISGAEWADAQQIKYCGFVWTAIEEIDNVIFTKVGDE